MQKPLTPQQIKTALSNEIRRADDEYSLTNRRDSHKTALAYYNGDEPRVLDDDVDEYFDGIVSEDVRNAVLATVAEVIPALAADRPASYKPEGPEDEDQADAESEAVGDLIMAGSHLALTTALMDALTVRTGFIETAFVERTECEYTTLYDVPVAHVPEVQARMAQGGEVEIVEIDDGKDNADMDEIYAPTDTVTLKLKRTHKTRKLENAAVPPDEMLLANDWESTDIEDIRFIARQRRVLRADLIAAGYDQEVVNSLPRYSASTHNEARAARQQQLGLYQTESSDESVDNILVNYCSYRIDVDRDGIAERWWIVAAGDASSLRILEASPENYVPWSMGCAWIRPHTPSGVSLVDRLKNTQDIRTKLSRQALQAGERAIRDRVGVMDDGSVNMNDAAETVFGGLVRMSSPQGIVPIPKAPFPNDVIQGIGGISDRMMAESGGSTVTRTDADNLPTETGALGMASFMVSIESSSAQVARIIGKTLIAGCFRKSHEQLRRYGRVDDMPEGVDPRQWPERVNVTLSTGLTLSDRQRLVGMLGQVKQDLMMQQQQGSPYVGPQQIYRVSVDAARMAGLDSAEAYYVDPSSDEGQRMAQQAQQAQQQQMMQQQQMQAQQAQQAFMQQAELARISGQMAARLTELQGQLKMLQDQANNQAKLVQLEVTNEQKDEEAADQAELEYDKLALDAVEIAKKYGGETPPTGSVQ